MSCEALGTCSDPPERPEAAQEYCVLALYKFVSPKMAPDDVSSLKAELEARCRAAHARGCILVAPEGINGTICYPAPDNEEKDEDLLAFLQKRFEGLRYRLSNAPHHVFARLKIKVKPEIVTLDRYVDPSKVVGTYVKPNQWNELLMDPECWVIDTRNEYEVRVGTFRNASDPHTQNFREFPEWLRRQKENKRRPPKKIAMFCTGGIRCEKATSLVLASALFPETPVYHLEGGILNYLDTVPPERSLFDGECYVFDQRVAVTHGLKPSSQYTSCFACRNPLSPQDRELDDYMEGISCRYCKDHLTDQKLQRFEERQRQVELAAKVGKPHMHDPKEIPLQE